MKPLHHSSLPASALLLATLALAACHVAKPAAKAPEIKPGVYLGYLRDDELPDSLALVPPPPASNSAAFASDVAIDAAANALRATPRWPLATADADLRFPHAATLFSCAAGASIDIDATPATYRLMQRTLADAVRAINPAKDHYHRPRPLLVDGQASCTPDDEARLRKSGSYPSGHAAIGWAWALVLAEADPTHADALIARGRSFGESRLVCHVHWNSDVVEARFVGAAVVAKLHDNPDFLADLAAAKRELASHKLAAPTQDCAAENAALAHHIAGAL